MTSRSEEEEEEGKKAIPEIGIWEFKDSAKRGIRRRGILHRKTILLFNLPIIFGRFPLGTDTFNVKFSLLSIQK